MDRPGNAQSSCDEMQAAYKSELTPFFPPLSLFFFFSFFLFLAQGNDFISLLTGKASVILVVQFVIVF